MNGLLLVLIVVVLLILGPLATIWALNTLFALGIVYNFWTWLAVIVLGAAIRARVDKD